MADGFGVLVLCVALGYFLPTIVAFARDVPGKGSVAVLNTFLGWTFVAWVVSMAQACGSPRHGPADAFGLPATKRSPIGQQVTDGRRPQ